MEDMFEESDLAVSSHVYNTSSTKQYSLLQSLVKKVCQTHATAARKQQERLIESNAELQDKMNELKAKEAKAEKERSQSEELQKVKWQNLQKKLNALEVDSRSKTDQVNDQRKQLQMKLEEMSAMHDHYEQQLDSLRKEATRDRQMKADLEAKLYTLEYDNAELQEELEYVQGKYEEVSSDVAMEKHKIQKVLSETEDVRAETDSLKAKVRESETFRKAIDAVINGEVHKGEIEGLNEDDVARVESLEEIVAKNAQLAAELLNKAETASALETYWRCKAQTAQANEAGLQEKLLAMEKIMMVLQNSGKPQSFGNSVEPTEESPTKFASRSSSGGKKRRISTEIQEMQLQQQVQLLTNKLSTKTRMIDTLQRNLSNLKSAFEKQKKMHQEGILVVTKELTSQLGVVGSEGGEQTTEKISKRVTPRSKRTSRRSSVGTSKDGVPMMDEMAT